jgi:mono/diheme cytochrome c family protein
LFSFESARENLLRPRRGTIEFNRGEKTMSYAARSGKWLRRAAIAGGLMGSAVFAGPLPYGLDARVPIGPYLNNIMPPTSTAFAFPPVLSQTGAFSDVSTLTPSTGIIPFNVNSPLWSDGASKSRWVAVPNDGPPYTPDEQISFVPTGEWTFPNGTVFIKHFELTVNEITGEKKRLETRLLVRNSAGAVYGVTYKWRADNTDADLLPGALDEDIPITTSSGTHIQKWSYPSRGQCLVCHNSVANYVLGVKTHQMNGDFTYPSTGRTDNQLRTFAHIGLLNPAPNEGDIPTFLKTVAVTDTSVPVQYRMRSWIDANCSHCHRPGGFGPGYDGRFYTPLEDQNLINSFVVFRDLSNSLLYQLDNTVGQGQMPPLAKNVVHEAAMANMRQWIASPFEILSVYLQQDTSHLTVKFNSHVDPATATVIANYSVDQGVTVSEAVMSSQPDTVILTVSPLTPSQAYLLTTSNVQDTAPSANTIWLQSQTSFVAQEMPIPTASRLANISTRIPIGVGDDVLIGGFIVRGGADKRIMIRGIGPSLSASGIPNALADPVLELYDSFGVLVSTNDNWADNANQQEIMDTGIAPASPKESVLLARLPSDDNGVAYTAILRDAGNTTGVGLLEVYDLDQGLSSKVLNISTRGRVDVGDNVLIGGVIVTGPVPEKVIIRAIGPSLPLSGPLADPTLELHDGNGGLLASNDNWRTNQEAEISATGIPPSNDLESAIVALLPPSNYTAIVRGSGDTTGVALVEVYSLN